LWVTKKVRLNHPKYLTVEIKMHFIFDLDGVLVDFRNLHRDAFINAWNTIHPSYPITHVFHATHLEARSTVQKIASLAAHFSIDPKESEVSSLKQQITRSMLDSAPVYTKTREALLWTKEHNISISCCSNSILATVKTSLQKLVSLHLFKAVLSNEDVKNPKPSPDIYLAALRQLCISSSDAIVFEDSEVGKAAARAAGIQVIEIVDALDISPRFLDYVLRNGVRPTPLSINVVVPMAGLGSRFSKEGYTTPKPFLPIFDKPMFETVLRNVIPESLFDRAQIHIVVRAEHVELFKAHTMTNLHVHTVPYLTEGAACTVLTLKDAINNDTPLVIANSDQYLEWSVDDFYRALYHPDWDGVISTFQQEDPSDLRWSYANVNNEGEVTQVAEKKFIGPLATTGIYGWKRGADYVTDTEAMIADNVRVNNEFYVCPVYNHSIARNLRIRTHNCKKMWGLGVPVDYEYFLRHCKGGVGP
jgi:beta-phosphoglucomutase-like phosphatase (HAD superfamily)/dTDP-glucose pyrophosphorylase